MVSNPSFSAALGMPEGAAAAYSVLLDKGTATVDELAAITGAAFADVTDHMAWLRDHGLVLRAKATAPSGEAPRWSAADPDHALRDLVRERERTLHQVRTALPDLQQRFRQAHQQTGHQVIEHIEGWESIGNRYHQILRNATDEVALWEHGPYLPGTAPTEESVLDRGVRFRVLCDPLDFPDQLAHEFAGLHGLEARLSPDVPFRGVVADRRIALVTMDREPQNLSAVVVHPSPILDGLTMLFDGAWSRAVPLHAPDVTLAPPERQVLGLLAAGLKDEAIARQLSTTTRTVRRRVQAVLTALGARSRFHAGVEAHRRGWV